MIHIRPLLAALAVGAAGCEPAPGLPEAEVLVEDNWIGSATASGAWLYWTADLGGEGYTEGRVMRQARSGGEPAVLASDQFNPDRLLLAGDTLYWGNRGDFVSCGGMMMLEPGGLPRAIGEDVCRPWPLNGNASLVTVVGERFNGPALFDIDPSSSAATERFVIEAQQLIDDVATDAGDVYLLLHDPSGGYVVRLLRGASAPEILASGIRSAAWVVVVGPFIYWLDRNDLDSPTQQVYRAVPGGEPEMVAELDRDVFLRDAVYVAGAIWSIAPGSAEEETSSHLVRLDLDDHSLTHHVVQYTPWRAAAAGDDLLVITEPTTNPKQILLQPL